MYSAAQKIIFVVESMPIPVPSRWVQSDVKAPPLTRHWSFVSLIPPEPDPTTGITIAFLSYGLVCLKIESNESAPSLRDPHYRADNNILGGKISAGNTLL
jgi:hypothetical protein